MTAKPTAGTAKGAVNSPPSLRDGLILYIMYIIGLSDAAFQA
jgi:hypothetical protein